ncbi:MAG TPA: helix-turn-helix domain-containing protein, partial [Streptosporangiaceae bacterium]|nr:helix-turn-helix domain-containing protein [Streptosporangiaceae bacterium]
DALTRSVTGAVSVDLPSGVVARLSCRRLSDRRVPDGRVADGVVHVKLISAALGAPDVPAPRSAMHLPGLVGSGVLWLRACREAEALYDSGEWLTLEGEPGVGKLALARGVHQRRNPAAPFHVLDAEPASQEWLTKTRRELLDGKGMLVIRHVGALNAKQMHALASALGEARAAGRQAELRVAITLNRKQATADLNPSETRLLRFFQGTVELPPLRHHIEDLHELVPFFLARLSQQGRLTCSTEAMQLLLRHSWPGNTEQLWSVLRQVVQRRRAGAIMPRDLPPECWTVSRRLLSPLESIERDAIVQSLQDHDGNKVRAAEALGMSRATIYRKIHEYGIVASTS